MWRQMLLFVSVLSLVAVVTPSIAVQPQVCFTENQGQYGVNTVFKAHSGPANLYFCRDEVVYLLGRYKNEPDKSQSFANMPFKHAMPKSEIETIYFRTKFIDANPNVEIVGFDRLSYKSNFFKGNDQSLWHTDVPSYGSIVYRNIYQGIDLKYTGRGSSAKYQFELMPGADPGLIKIAYDGIDLLSLNSNGDLQIQTSFGTVMEKAPVIYQEINGTRNSIAGRFDLIAPGILGFKIDGIYDSSFPLVIDPELIYSTYFGGSGTDLIADIYVDPQGYIYIVGCTDSPNFPTENPYDPSNNGSYDAILSKFWPGGDSLVFSTYLGSSSLDYATGVEVDPSGNCYVAGRTDADDFPTINAFDPTFNGNYDTFVTKLSPEGNSLIYSTFIGGGSGDGGDLCFGLDIDNSGQAYITGITASGDFPTLNAYQSILRGGDDVFVTVLSASGTSLIFSTFLGGTMWGDYGSDIVVDSEGNSYITGQTESQDFPTLNAFDSTAGDCKAIVAKFSPSGNLEFCTFLGGEIARQSGEAIALDNEGNIYVTGSTTSRDFPTVNAYSGHLRAGDIFVSKFSPSGQTLLYSTLLGGWFNEEALGIAVDADQNAYVVGITNSNDFPMVNAIDDQCEGEEAVIVKLPTTRGCVTFSTYLGGSGADGASTVALDAQGNVWLAGNTNSHNFPMINPFDPSYNDSYGESDIFISAYQIGDVIANPTGSVGGIVTDIQSNPLEGIRILASGTGREDTTDAQGAYKIENLCSGYADILTADSLYNDTLILGIPVNSNDVTVLDITLLSSGTVSGFVTDTLMHPLENAVVTLWGNPPIFDTTDVSGAFSFNDLRPGTYDSLNCRRDHYFSTLIENISVQPGDQTLIPITMIGKPENVRIWFGNPYGRPINVMPGDQVPIDVYIQTADTIYIGYYLAIQLGAMTNYITGFTSGTYGAVYYPFSGWEDAIFREPLYPPDIPDGWISQTVGGFQSYNGPLGPPMHFPEPTKIATFVATTINDMSLIGDTVECLGSGFYPGVGWGTIAFDSLGINECFVYDYYSPICFTTTHDYRPGDANGNGVFNGLDVVYAVNFLKGTGSPPPSGMDCPPHSFLYAAADANGSCSFNGLDVTFMVRYFKGEIPSALYCSDCPPSGLNPPGSALLPPQGSSSKTTINDNVGSEK